MKTKIIACLFLFTSIYSYGQVSVTGDFDYMVQSRYDLSGFRQKIELNYEITKHFTISGIILRGDYNGNDISEDIDEDYFLLDDYTLGELVNFKRVSDAYSRELGMGVYFGYNTKTNRKGRRDFRQRTRSLL